MTLRLFIGYRPCADRPRTHVGDAPVTIHAIRLGVHAGHVDVGLGMARLAVGVDHITGVQTWGMRNIVPRDVAHYVAQPFFCLERQFDQKIVRGMAVITRELGVHTHFLGHGSFLHDMTAGAERPLVRGNHGICQDSQ